MRTTLPCKSLFSERVTHELVTVSSGDGGDSVSDIGQSGYPSQPLALRHHPRAGASCVLHRTGGLICLCKINNKALGDSQAVIDPC